MFMALDSREPYNALPVLPPASDIENREILRKTVTAARALAELRQAGRLIPNQSVLINTIPLLEAHDSSEIENVVTTTDALFRLAARENVHADSTAKEAYRCRTAMRLGFEDLQERPLGTNTAVLVYQALLNTTAGIRQVPGTCIGNPVTGEIDYTPPEGESLIRDRLSDWERFLHAPDGLDPLIRLAMMHYQFEAIHPFTDGNGRTGRILNLLYLIQSGLLDIPVLYLSRYILRRRSDYYELLLDVTRRAAWEPWILYMLDAVEETAGWTTRKIEAIRNLMSHTAEFIRERESRIYSRELCEVIFTQPYCRIANLEEAGIAKRQTGSVYLKKLVRLGVLREELVGRDKLFLHPRFMHLLTSEENKFDSYHSR
jgi:Fic family protein